MKLLDSMSISSLIIWTNTKFIWDNFLKESSFISVVENHASRNQVEPVLLDLMRSFVLEKLASALGRGGWLMFFCFVNVYICLYVCVPGCGHPWKSEDCIRSLGTGIMGGCKPPCGGCAPNWGSLQEQRVL